MNYRHAFHAGNFADVFKHTLLIALIEALRQKPAPFCYFDTHAGAGRYDLAGEEARKTGEYLYGIQRLLELSEDPAPLRAYLDLIRTFNADTSGRIAVYPGSPLIAARLLRGKDRAVLCETQSAEAADLKTLFANDARIGVHRRDGYAALGALLPPKERRGLVLIDPPFETQDDEFRDIEKALATAYALWPTGVYAVWYPIKLRAAIGPFHRWFLKQGIRKVLAAELLVQPDDSPLRLNGCGMIVINPPWKFEQQLRELLPVLQRWLAQHGAGSFGLGWVMPE